MKTTNLTTEELKQIQILQDKKNQDLLKRFILDQTEAKIKDRFSDKELDAENEKRKLLSSFEDLWKIKKLDSQVLKSPAEYEAIFTQEYYVQIYRLNGWEYKDVIAQKPWRIARYTNEIIYYRFASEVLPFLRMLNPFIVPGVRRFKHHQYLTPGARHELSKSISQATALMMECTDWNEFRIKYCTMYNVPYQLRLL